MAPGRGLEPRTLRLTDRRRPFRTRELNSPSVPLSAAKRYGLPPRCCTPDLLAEVLSKLAPRLWAVTGAFPTVKLSARSN